MQKVYLFVCFLIWSEDAVKRVLFEPDDSVPHVASFDVLNSNRNVNLMEVWAHNDSVVCSFAPYVFMFPYPGMVAMVQCSQRFTPAPTELSVASTVCTTEIHQKFEERAMTNFIDESSP